MSSPKTKSKVFFLPWESRNRLHELLEISGAANKVSAGDLVAIKMHFGEKGNVGYIQPEYVRPVIRMIKQKKGHPFLTDTNTIYNGMRTNAVTHLTLAASHGFSQTRLHTPIIIADGLRGDDHIHIDINGAHFKKVKIASAIQKADAMIVLSHFKGHLIAGFGGTIKNLGMGCGSRLGKFEMHSSASPTVSPKNCTACGACIVRCAHGALSLVNGHINLDTAICAGCGECVIVCNYRALSIAWNEGTKRVQEKIVEYAVGAIKKKRTFYLNFVNHITSNCDCLGLEETPLAPNIGILASDDPVAIDQASLDLVIKRSGDVFKKERPEIDGTIQLAYAEQMGIGTRDYEMVDCGLCP